MIAPSSRKTITGVMILRRLSFMPRSYHAALSIFTAAASNPSMRRDWLTAFRARCTERGLTAVVAAMDAQAARGAIGAAPAEGQVRGQAHEKQRSGDAPDDGGFLGNPEITQQTAVDDISRPGHQHWILAIHQQRKLRVR